jgi:arylsulfatase A-like enzyme
LQWQTHIQKNKMMMNLRRSIGISLTVAWVFPVAAANTAAAAAKPNVICILADDLGYGDLGCYGQKRIKTPSLDKMAAEGIRFTDHYAGSTVCAPSRCVLMTGLHTGHCQIRNNQEVQPMGQAPLRPNTPTVARLMQQAGYATALIGKWGLGGPGSTGVPNQQGFDDFFGYLCQRHAHNYYPEFLFRNEKRVPLLGNKLAKPRDDGAGVAVERGQYAPDLCADEALRFIERNKDRPFFLCFTPTLPHANNEAGNQGMEVPSLGEYAKLDWPAPQKGHAAMISRLDAHAGMLLDKLKELGLDGKTVVFFTSDNGPHREGGCDPDFNDSNGPLRGMKRDLYDGGIRVPLIVRWPGKIRPGTTSGLISAFWDFLPTACELAGAKPPQNTDGISYLPTLLGDDAQQQKHESLYWEYAGTMAVRAGKWKAVGNPRGNRFELYDLESDPGESKNLAADNPQIVERIKKIMTAAHAAEDHPIHLGSLLEDMLDRTKIAEFPQPEFICKQASSYNRRSKTPGNPDWFAGCDFDQFYGSTEVGGRKEWIMLDVDGPGVVTRWWLPSFKTRE